MLLFVMLGQLLTLDMSLTLYMTCALAAFLAAQSAPPRADAAAGCSLAWAAIALGVLTKGLVAAAIPGGGARALQRVARAILGPGGGCMPRRAARCSSPSRCPGTALAAHRAADFFEFFFIHEHLQRYLTPSADREQAWWFFGAGVPARQLALDGAGAARACIRLAARAGRRGFDPALFLRIWVRFVLRVFLALRLQADPVHFARDGRRLRCSMAGLPARTIARDLIAHGDRSPSVSRWRSGFVCLFAPRTSPLPSAAPTSWRSADRIAQVAVLLAASGLYVLIAEKAQDHPLRGVPRRGLGSRRAAARCRPPPDLAPIYSGVELARALPTVPPDATLYSVGPTIRPCPSTGGAR